MRIHSFHLLILIVDAIKELLIEEFNILRQRIINRTYRRHVFNNRIAQLPLRITTDSFSDQLFNGSSFY